MSELIEPNPYIQRSELTPAQTIEFDLFTEGTLVHVGRLSRISKYLSEGIYSPAALAKKAEREIKNPGFWFPNDNLVVKFLRMESSDRQVNFHALVDHFEMFGDFDEDRAIGLITRKPDVQRMSEGEPYFSVNDILPSSDLVGVVLPIIPMLLPHAEHMHSAVNRKPAEILRQAVEQAIKQGTLHAPFYIVDHFGKPIHTALQTF